MSGRSLPLLLALTLVLPLVQAAGGDPHGRAPLALDAPVNAVVLASNGGILAVATDDPGSRVPAPGELQADRRHETWLLYFPDGRSVRQSGDVDPTDCDGALPTDDCQTDATHLVVDRSGNRLVAGGAISTSNSTLVFATANAGEIHQAFLAGAIQSLAMSEDGSLVAVATSLPITQQGDKGRLYLFEWSASSVAAPKIVTTVEGATDIAVSPDGASVAAAAGNGHHYRLRRDGTATVDNIFPGIGTDVAVSASARHLSVAGSTDGWFVLYSDDSGKDLRELRLRDESNSVQAVAIRRDGTALAVGNSQGDIWVYAVDPAVAIVTRLIGTAALNGSVLDLAFARDGNTLVGLSGSSLSHFAVSSSGLPLLWEQPGTGYISVAIDEAGETVAVGAASATTLYDATHAITATGPAAQTGAPGSLGQATVTLRNTGNRFETVNLQLEAPNGWGAAISNASLTLAPAESGSVSVTWAVPAFEAPAARELNVRATLAGRSVSAVDTRIAVTVPEVRAWELDAEGAQSLGVRAGQPTLFGAVVRNLGNVPGSPPLSVRIDETGWGVRLLDLNGTTAPGQSTAVFVEMTPPATAPELADAVATLTLAGPPAQTLRFTGTVGASFGVELTVPPGVEVVAGNESRVNLAARNAGNALDGIRIDVGSVPSGWTVAFVGGGAVHEAPQVSAGQSVQATLIVHAPESAAGGAPIQVTVTARSLADPTQTVTRTFLASAVAPPTSTDTPTKGGDGNGIPGLGLPLLLLAFACVGFAGRKAKGP